MQYNLQTSLVSNLKFKYINEKKDYKIINGRLVKVNPNIYLQQTTRKQYIDTSYNITTNTNIDLNFTFANGMRPLGVNAGTTARYILVGLNSSLWAAIWQPVGSGTSVLSNVYTKTNLHTENNELYINDTLKYTGGTPVDIDKSLYLFAHNSNGTVSYADDGINSKIYSLDIYEGDILARSLRPVPSGLVIGDFTCPSNGMFDIVEQQFYGNSGEDNFTCGKDE